MAMKFGTLLVREGVISPEQLEEAIRIQGLYGGRIGTNLLELGAIDIDVLAEWLAHVMRAPVATEAMFEEAGEDVRALLPIDVVEKYECYPLRKDGRRLHVAMANPLDLPAVDALSFHTGLRIVTYVAPEARLYHYLERRYGLVRKLGYVRLAPGPRSTPPANAPLPAKNAPPPPAASTPPSARPAAQTTPPPLPPVASTPPPPSSHQPPVMAPVQSPVAAPAAVQPAEDVAEALSKADSRTALADAVLSLLQPHFDTVVLLFVRDGDMLGWQGASMGAPLAQAARLMSPLESESIFQHVADAQQAFAGASQPAPLHDAFVQALGVPFPAGVVVAPVIVRGATVNLVYGDRRASADVTAAAEAVDRVCEELARAWERLAAETLTAA